MDRKEKLKVAMAALDEIVHPIRYMQERLQRDEQLDGVMAIHVANSPDYLRGIARKALERITEPSEDKN